ncbi:MAG: crossover junction endodeoxyribonuclease RuvC [Deltaproteobacteria bacterium]|nr:crossover junction endodeoxyribonuclease RuvC [Deltaproteobacteria bacterium]
MSSRLRVLGIDPGSLLCGWGVVDEVAGGYAHVDCGVVEAPRGAPLAERLERIYRGLRERIDALAPQVAAVESVFFAANVKSAIVLGQARGVALLAAAHAGLPVHEYSPTQIKKALVGYGRADKPQIAAMVQCLLGLPEPAQADASDALAAALCHLSSYRYLQMVGRD